MPISTNAPFNEFGQSMILRDIEQLWLALNGAGTGGPGEGQTQDQSVGVSQETGDSAGLTDLSGLATTDYVDAALASILSGLAGSVTGIPRRTAMSTAAGSGTFTPPSNTTYYICIAIAAGAGSCSSSTPDFYVAASSGGSASTAHTVSGPRWGGGGSAVVSLIAGVPVSYSIGAGGGTSALFGAAGGQTTVTGTGVSITTYGGGLSQPLTGGYGGAPPVYSGANILWAYGFAGQPGINLGWAGLCINGWNVGRGSGSAALNGGVGFDGGVLFLY